MKTPRISPYRRRFAAPLALLALLALTLGPTAPAAGARESLVLRVNDAIAPPAGLAAVVIRTYASKPISQGQVCFRLRSARKTLALPFTAIEAVKVFSQRGDGASIAAMDVAAGEQMIVIEFSSQSGTINQTDGPLAVIYFRVSPGVSPGERYEIAIDAANTAVVDRAGQPVKIAPRAGELLIRHPGDPYTAEADDDKITPGDRAELGIETFEPVAMASGQIGFTWDPAIARGRPRVKMSSKYGKRRFQVDTGVPGLAFVTFRSPDASFNRVPGQILSVTVPTLRRLDPSTRSRITIDPSLTFFVGPEGNILPYEFEDGTIRFTEGGGGGGGGDDDGGSSGDDDSDSSSDDDSDSDSSSDDDSDSSSDDDSDSSSDDDSDSSSDDDSDSSGDDDSDSSGDDDSDSSGGDDDSDSSGDDDSDSSGGDDGSGG